MANKISVKLVKLAKKIIVHRNEMYKISSISLVMKNRGYPSISYVRLAYFSEEAQEFILKHHPLILSSLEIELL